MADPDYRSQPSFLRTALWLGAFLLLAFTLRSVFTAQVGYDGETESHLFTGNDPYFHHYTTNHVLEEGSNLDRSTNINYPEGRDNPNPPLWTWTSAVVASLLQALNVGGPDFAGSALNFMVAVWGALCILPIYMITRDLWGRRAGLWAAFFMAISAPHIQRSIWGYADHDAISMFFILLAFAFIVRGFKAADLRESVAHWNRGSAVAAGLRDAVRRNRDPLVYATLAGLSITACALAWKGYPYVFAILALAAFAQLVLDHMRNRDSTVTWMVYFIVIGLGAVLPWLLYYQWQPAQLASTVIPSLYVLGGVVLLGLVLVPTRDLPSVLVFPALLIATVLGMLYLAFFQPGVWGSITTGLGYFQQSKLYSTIAEAQRPPLGQVAATLGFFTFVLAFWGFFRTLRMSARGDAPNILVASWAVVAMFMMFAAARFEVNAAPLFCVLLGYVLDRLVAIMAPGDMRKRFRSSHGQNPVTRSFRSLTWKGASMALGIALLLVLPMAWLAVDASMPPEYEAECCKGLTDYTREVLRYDLSGQPEYGSNYENPPRLGALGISFGDIAGGEKWLQVMTALSKRDTCRSDPEKVCQPGDPDYQPQEERPAFIAWWDYGHWAVAIGKHPTVADPFQSHFELSGRVLASDSEEEAMSWLTILLLRGDRALHSGEFSAPVRDLLQRTNPGLLSIGSVGYYREDKATLDANLNGTDIFRFYEDVCAATDKCVEYLGVSSRMFPTRDEASIFYAPVYLADKNPDEYIETKFVVDFPDNQRVTVTQHGYIMVDNASVRLDKARYTDDTSPANCVPLAPPPRAGTSDPQPCTEYIEYQGYLYRAGQTPLQGYATESGGQLLGQYQQTSPTPKFFNTFYAKAFPNTLMPGTFSGQKLGSPAGDGLKHWRAIEETFVEEIRDGQPVRFRGVVLLAYFRGVNAQGVLQDDAGNPMPGYTVTIVDGHGASHGEATTGPDGRYNLTAPFSVGGDLAFQVRGGAGEVVHSMNGTEFQFTFAQARNGDPVTLPAVRISRGQIGGLVYEERTGNTTYEEGKDEPLAGAQVFLVPATGNKTLIATTDASGRFTSEMTFLPNDYTVEAHKWPDYTNSTIKTVTVPSGGKGDVRIGMAPAPTRVKATFIDRDGDAVGGIPMVFTGPNGARVTGDTNATGVASVELAPGTWQIAVNHTAPPGTADNGTPPPPRQYRASGTITVERFQREAMVTVREEQA